MEEIKNQDLDVSGGVFEVGDDPKNKMLVPTEEGELIEMSDGSVYISFLDQEHGNRAYWMPWRGPAVMRREGLRLSLPKRDFRDYRFDGK